MQTSFAPFTGQGSIGQFYGQSGVGPPQGGFGASGLAGPMGQFGPFGQELGQMGQGQPYYPPVQFGQGGYGQSSFAGNLYGYNGLAQQPQIAQLLQSAFAQRQFSPFQQQAVVQQVLPLLGHLTQQAYFQCATTQQIAATLHQLTQIALQAIQSGVGLTGQSFGQPFGQQSWGAGRPQTLQ